MNIFSQNSRLSGIIISFLIVMLFSACSGPVSRRDSGPRPGSVDVSSIPDAIPKIEAKSKYGNPTSYEVFGKRYYVMNSAKGFVESGIASWYGNKFHGRRTSSGESYDMYGMTAAHKNLPLPTYVEVTNLKNGKRVVVKVNDRGPFHENRIIDLSYTAATKLDIVKQGTGLVEIRVIDPVTYAKGSSNNRSRAPATTSTATPVGAPVATPVIAKATAVPVSSQANPASLNNEGFYIQVGAFSSLLNAENLREKLGVLENTSIHINEVEVNGSKVYRVRIGPMLDIDTADSIVSTLDKYGVSEHRIVID